MTYGGLSRPVLGNQTTSRPTTFKFNATTEMGEKGKFNDDTGTIRHKADSQIISAEWKLHNRSIDL